MLGIVTLFAAACPAPTPSSTLPTSSAHPEASTVVSGSWDGPRSHKPRKVTHARRAPRYTSEPHDLAHAIMQNERDDDDREILANGSYCRVRVPPSGPISTDHVEYDYEEVDCPSSYDDPAWDDCTTTIFKEPKGCYCTPESDEPPSPPTRVDCPAPR
jgi:hypothetical protein